MIVEGSKMNPLLSLYWGLGTSTHPAPFANKLNQPNKVPISKGSRLAAHNSLSIILFVLFLFLINNWSIID